MSTYSRQIVVALLLFAEESAWAQPPARRSLFSVVTPEPSSYSLAEFQRQAGIARQIQVQDQIRWLSGLPLRQPGVVQPSLDFVYSGATWGPPTGWPVPFLFEPWPLVPGDIYAAPYLQSVPQPTGFEVTPTGSNGYIYRPTFSYEPSVTIESPAPQLEPRPAPVEEAARPAPRVLREF